MIDCRSVHCLSIDALSQSMGSSALLHSSGVMTIENGQLTMVVSGPSTMTALSSSSSLLATNTIESPDVLLPEEDEYRNLG